ncbi:helix-turn-helix domain-containing protein [Arhodomonas aquaeolei]|uniref:helix-turn-helix domain-containing protein n=1 Tax=Arhodomonas aquaeolei TaxID=2369 RepID=UPI0035B5B58F
MNEDTEETYTVQIGERVIGSDELVDADIAARITGLSPRTIRDKAARREIPVYRVARTTTRFLVRDLVEWSDERRLEVGSA